MNERNRYLTPFDDIIPIKFASWCQHARVKAQAFMRVFLKAQEDAGTTVLNEKECQGKKRYLSYRDAAFAVGGRKEALGRTGDTTSLIGLHPYSCSQCGGWHIGHRPGSAEKIRKVREEQRKGRW